MQVKKEPELREPEELFTDEDTYDTFYKEDEIESLLEDDEISDEEEAFMMGYIDDEA